MSEPCLGFHWMGQTWESCDVCGRPWHEHDGLWRPKPGSADAEIMPWSREDR